MPKYSSDSRIPAQVVYKIVDSRTGQVYNQRTTVFSKTSGVVKTFDGPSEGKFVPGVVRINNMTATRVGYVYESVDWLSGGYNPDYVDTTIQGPATVAIPWSTIPDSNTWDPSLTGYAVQRAHARLLHCDEDVGEFLAELPETIRMVRGGVASLVRAIAAAKRTGFTWSRVNRARLALLQGKSVKRLPRSLANAWLTWRYGVRPLIWDTQALIKICNDKAESYDFSGLRRVRGRAVKHTTSEPRRGITDVIVTPNGRVAWREQTESELKAEAVVYYKWGAGFGDLTYVLRKYGLHPTQFPYLLWQLVPLSFMLDWFVDVGTWVKAITPKWQFEVLGCSCSQKTTHRTVRINRYAPPTYYPRVRGGLTTDSRVQESIDRRRQTLLGEFPRLKPKVALSIQQQVDLLAVLLQRALNQGRR